MRGLQAGRGQQQLVEVLEEVQQQLQSWVDIQQPRLDATDHGYWPVAAEQLRR